LRFHLTVLGIGTDLAVLDERYLFTGARFLVQLVAAIPNLVLVALVAALVLYPIGRAVPRRIRSRAWLWWSHPARVTLIGIVVSVLIIQGAMRQCFTYSNLLVAPHLPREPAWLSELLLADSLVSIYFDALVAGCLITAGLLWSVRGAAQPMGRGAGFARTLLGFLVAVQALLLPVNYGTLMVDKSLPRVAAIGDKPLADGEEAWLAWEGKDGVTWLVRSRRGTTERRTLVTLPRGDAKRIEIIGYDPILPTLFATPREARP